MMLPAINRSEFIAATDLIREFGSEARAQAAVRAHQSRDRGNVIHFCEWRQVERLIIMLSAREVCGTVH